MLLLPVAAAALYGGRRAAALHETRTANAVMQTGAGGCTAFLVGDSGISRWPLRPAPGWQIRSLSKPGATTAAVAGPARAAIAAARPHLLVINMGGNDAAGIAFLWGARRRTEITRSAGRIAGLARAGQAAGARVVVMGLVPPAGQPWWRAALIGGRQGAAMAAIEAATRLPAGAARIDVAKLLGHGGRSDYLHFTPAGYARIDAALAPYREAACAVSSVSPAAIHKASA